MFKLHLVQAKFLFEPRDLWMGVYWTPVDQSELWIIGIHRAWHIYICLIPMLPLFLYVGLREEP